MISNFRVQPVRAPSIRINLVYLPTSSKLIPRSIYICRKYTYVEKERGRGRKKHARFIITMQNANNTD